MEVGLQEFLVPTEKISRSTLELDPLEPFGNKHSPYGRRIKKEKTI